MTLGGGADDGARGDDAEIDLVAGHGELAELDRQAGIDKQVGAGLEVVVQMRPLADAAVSYQGQ